MSQSTQCLGSVVPLAMFIIKKYICGYLQIITSTYSNCSSMIQSVEVDEYQVIIGGDCCWTSFKAIWDSWLGYNDSASDFFWSLFRLLFWPICRKRIQSAFSVLQPSAYERVMQSVYTIKSTHNRFQHYKKNDINVALSFLPID